MKNLFLFLTLSLFTLTSLAGVEANTAFTIDGLNDEVYELISKDVSGSKDMSIEYYCLETGLMVMKVYKDMPDDGDYKVWLKAKLKKHLAGRKIEFLLIKVQRGSSPSKC